MRRTIDRIRAKVRRGEYVLTIHAIEEMGDEGFAEGDFEQAALTGRLVRRERDHLGRGKYTIEGTALDQRVLRGVCRFSDTGESVVVITVYEG